MCEGLTFLIEVHDITYLSNLQRKAFKRVLLYQGPPEKVNQWDGLKIHHWCYVTETANKKGVLGD